MKSAALSDIGKVRKGNEDAFYVAENLFAVADGMGGHMAGEVASAVALDVLKEGLKTGKHANPQALLKKRVDQANAQVYKSAQEKPELYGMGTTLTALLIIDKILNFAHIGDSRAYLLRQGKLKQLTEDHSVVAEMVRQGKLRPEEAERHPARSILTRALGTEPEAEIDVFQETAKEGDKILLCTDGLNSIVGDPEIEKTLNQNLPLPKICQQLVAAANDKGGYDNITVVVVEF